MSSPLAIGISSCFFHADPKRAIFKGKTLVYLEQSMGDWVMSEGAVAFMLPPPTGKVSLTQMIQKIDGLVLQGGADVSPKSYGESPLRPEWEGDFIRDQYEIALIEECLKQDKPVLGICRGAQVLNVALGGTLYQDIDLQLENSFQHRNWDVYDQNFHEIRIQPESLLSQMYSGALKGRVNSVHHQGLSQLGKGLEVEAWSEPDDVIEAVRLRSDRYAFGVQWHPEFQFAMNPNDPHLLDSRPIMQEFLNAVKKRNES